MATGQTGKEIRNEPVGSEKYLYVLEIVGRGVKVGITANPKQRLAAHRRDAKAYGRSTGRSWVSEPHINASENERALMRMAGPKQKREYLPLDFDVVVSSAHAQTRTQLDPHAEEERAQRTFGFFKAIVTGETL